MQVFKGASTTRIPAKVARGSSTSEHEVSSGSLPVVGPDGHSRWSGLSFSEDYDSFTVQMQPQSGMHPDFHNDVRFGGFRKRTEASD